MHTSAGNNRYHRAILTVLAILFVLPACRVSADGQMTPLPAPIAGPLGGTASGPQTAVFSGGCFWGVEAVFRHVGGVVSATSGYSGGGADSANYERVSSGTTGHAESVKVVYDPARVSYGQLLRVFFSVAHDPTQVNRQGPDHGTQYRSAIFYTSAGQRDIARAYIERIQPLYGAPIATEVRPLQAFYPAESYHQNYLALHPGQPYIVVNDLPKLEHLRAQLPELYR